MPSAAFPDLISPPMFTHATLKQSADLFSQPSGVDDLQDGEKRSTKAIGDETLQVAAL